jgi:chemotaxis protein histidine kinase CheA
MTTNISNLTLSEIRAKRDRREKIKKLAVAISILLMVLGTTYMIYKLFTKDPEVSNYKMGTDPSCYGAPSYLIRAGLVGPCELRESEENPQTTVHTSDGRSYGGWEDPIRVNTVMDHDAKNGIEGLANSPIDDGPSAVVKEISNEKFFSEETNETNVEYRTKKYVVRWEEGTRFTVTYAEEIVSVTVDGSEVSKDIKGSNLYVTSPISEGNHTLRITWSEGTSASCEFQGEIVIRSANKDDEAAKKAAEEKAAKEAEEDAKKAAEEKAARESEEKAKLEAARRAQEEAERRAAEAKAAAEKAEAEEKARLEAEAKAAEEARILAEQAAAEEQARQEETNNIPDGGTMDSSKKETIRN